MKLRLTCLILLAGPFAGLCSSIGGTTLQLSKKIVISDTLEAQSELNKKAEASILPRTSSALLADRLSCIEKTIPLSYNSRVHAFIDYFTIRNRDYTRMVMRRVDAYFPLFEKYLIQYNLPDELKYMAILESGLNPRAVSKVGAVGLWQFMPSTGRDFNLSSNLYVDERRDPEKSTKAACQYLAKLYTMFKDWELVLVAYNLGLGNVRKAIKKAGYSRQINAIYRYLPRETRSYLSQFVAINYVLNYSKDHNLFILEKELPMAHDTLAVKGFLHFETFSKLTRANMDNLRKLNPSILREIVPDDGKTHILKVPIWAKRRLDMDRVAILDSASKIGKREFTKNMKKSSQNGDERESISYLVQQGDILGTIARRFRVRVSDIQRWNKLHNTLIRTGQRIILWVPSPASY